MNVIDKTQIRMIETRFNLNKFS